MPAIVPCNWEHIDSLSGRLREGDRQELFLASGYPPEFVLMESFALSSESWAVVEGDVVLCVFGLSTHPHSPDWGIPWLLASEDFYRIGFRFARECREVIHRMFSKYPKLINMVHAENHKAIRWLSWCGFTFHDPIEAGPFNTPFIPFTKEKSNV